VWPAETGQADRLRAVLSGQRNASNGLEEIAKAFRAFS
jgi:hypothetical protein